MISGTDVENFKENIRFFTCSFQKKRKNKNSSRFYEKFCNNILNVKGIEILKELQKIVKKVKESIFENFA